MKRFYLFSFVLPATLVLVFGAVFSAMALTYPSSLVSYWPFDAGSGTVAFDAAGENDGTLVNDPTWTDGRVNGALQFNGIDDYVSLGNDSSLDLTDNFEVSFWMKIDQAAYPPNDWVCPINRIDEAGLYEVYWFICVTNDGSGKLQLGSGEGPPDWKATDMYSTVSVVDGSWHHVVWQRVNDDYKVFIDGIDRTDLARYNVDSGVGDVNASQDIYVGGDVESNDWYFPGEIDEVAIYNAVLSDEEILLHYERGLVGFSYFENTPAGTEVEVVADEVTIVFTEVAEAGDTTVSASESGEEVPGGFQLGDPPIYYMLTTTAEFTGPVKVCFGYDESALSGSEENLKVLHFEDSEWVDATTSVDIEENIICAEVESFSAFVLATQNSIEGLIQSVGEMNFDEGIAMSLVQKLYVAQRADERATARTTARALEAFVREVKALSVSQVTPEQVDELVVYAMSLLSFL